MSIYSFACLIGALIAGPALAQQPVNVKLDSSQANAALAIMDAVTEGGGAAGPLWHRLRASRPYIRLKQREASFNVGFTDAEFGQFLVAQEQLSRRVALADTLRRWEEIDMDEAGQLAFRYLPDGAKLEAEIYFMIKPKENSFVWNMTGEPAVFLYLNPTESASTIRNTVAHELHHVGMARACPTSAGPEGAATLLRGWSGAFGEGLAMMAAAGGRNQHPHVDSPAQIRAMWDESMTRFEDDLRRQDAFFVSMLREEAGDGAAVSRTMGSYYGEQGPWYTVGWKMAEVIERIAGRQAVIKAFCNRGEVFIAYNDAARQLNASGERLPLWSDAVIRAMVSPT